MEELEKDRLLKPIDNTAQEQIEGNHTQIN